MEVLLKFYDEQFNICLPNSYDELLKEISKKYHIPHNELKQLQVFYKDSDNDTILILSNEDLGELRKQVTTKEVNEIQIELNETSKMFLSQFHNKSSFVHVTNELSSFKEKCCSCLLIMKSHEGVNCGKCGFNLCDKCKIDFFHQHPLVQREKVEGKTTEKKEDEGYFYHLMNLFKKIPARMESMFSKSGNFKDPYEELIKKARELYDLRNISNEKIRYALLETNGSIENAVILLTQNY